MAIKFENIKNSALKLDERQRAELAKHLLISLEGYTDEDIEEEWIQELNRRKQDVEAGEVSLISADEVLAKAREILTR